MKTIDDVHLQFASFFQSAPLAPFAYLLSKRMQEGHTCIHQNDVAYGGSDFPFQPPFASLKKIAPLVGLAGQVCPFILHKDRLYLHRYFSYETQILQSIGNLLHSERALQSQREQQLLAMAPTLQWLQADYPLDGNSAEEKIDWQFAAAIQGVLHNFSIITGGPGTGKTTTVAKILALLLTLDPNCSVALAAPTGKAAMRMAESLQQTALPVPPAIKDKFNALQPNTIHRLLGYIPDSIYFKHHQDNPLPFNVVIVDEASMIDVALFAKLLSAIGHNTRLILLGDKNQLASVEAGSLFGDLCKAQEQTNLLSTDATHFINGMMLDEQRKITANYMASSTHPLAGHIIELQKSHRFTSIGGIGQLSKAIIQNNEAVLEAFIKQSQDAAVSVETTNNPTSFEAFIEGYKNYLQEPDISLALQKLNQLRVLCAVREGPQGLYAVNRAIENYLSAQHLLEPKGDFYENRPIIITKNYPDLQLYNGDIGLIRKDSKGNLRAWFEDSEKNIRAVMPGYISHAETVFAMTIHKSQGSEYGNVWVVLPQIKSSQLLTRELLYTAVTRAKEKVTVQSDAATLLETAKATVKRASGIIHRFDEI